MNKLMQYLGVIVVLIGALILMMYYFGIFSSNSALATAAIVMILGVVAHVVLNKIFVETEVKVKEELDEE